MGCTDYVMMARPNLIELSDSAKRATLETVSAILTRKGRDVWSIAPDATVYTAIGMMAAKGAGALLVMSQARPVGIVSERDYARRVILMGKSSKETLVREIMTSPVITVPSENTVEDCLWIMTTHRFRHLPVVDDGNLMGLLSIGDLVRSILSVQAHTIDQLHTYITNTYPK